MSYHRYFRLPRCRHIPSFPGTATPTNPEPQCTAPIANPHFPSSCSPDVQTHHLHQPAAAGRQTRDTSHQLPKLAAAKLRKHSQALQKSLFTSQTAYQNLEEPATPLRRRTRCQQETSPKAWSEHPPGTPGTNTALALFPQLKPGSQQQVSRCTVFISYRVHNKLLSTCNLPKKVTYNVKKYSIFCSFFVFKFFLYIF